MLKFNPKPLQALGGPGRLQRRPKVLGPLDLVRFHFFKWEFKASARNPKRNKVRWMPASAGGGKNKAQLEVVRPTKKKARSQYPQLLLCYKQMPNMTLTLKTAR